MSLTVVTYLLYLALAGPLTVWVARVLHQHGEAFLDDVFAGDVKLSHAVNQLLVIGFYLFNLGYVAVFMTSSTTVTTLRQLLETLSFKVGTVSIVLAVLHFANVWALNAFRRRAVLRAKAIPPIAPSGYTAVSPPGAGGASNAPAWPAPAPAWTAPGWTAPPPPAPYVPGH